MTPSVISLGACPDVVEQCARLPYYLSDNSNAPTGINTTNIVERSSVIQIS